jgi:SpoIIAA-like
MLDHELLSDTGILIVRPKEPLSAQDFAGLTAEVDAYIRRDGLLNGLMICAEKFPGWENLEGAISHFRFIRDHHRKIAKIAFVSDSDLLAALPKLAAHFVKADVRHFKPDQEAQALAWLSQ